MRFVHSWLRTSCCLHTLQLDISVQLWTKKNDEVDQKCYICNEILTMTSSNMHACHQISLTFLIWNDLDLASDLNL